MVTRIILLASLAWIIGLTTTLFTVLDFDITGRDLILIGGVTMMNLVYARIAMPTTISGIRYMGALFPFSQLLAIIYYKVNSYHFIGPLLVSLQVIVFIFYSYSFGLKIAF